VEAFGSAHKRGEAWRRARRLLLIGSETPIGYRVPAGVAGFLAGLALAAALQLDAAIAGGLGAFLGHACAELWWRGERRRATVRDAFGRRVDPA
jgi:hypothetical protein